MHDLTRQRLSGGMLLALLVWLASGRNALADQSGPANSPTITVINSTRVRKVAPHPLADVASIVEADVAKVSDVFDQRLGPRHVIELANVVVHAGAPLPSTTFSQLGGSLPDGSYVDVIELPRFTTGARYILFFAQNASVYTAVWARLAFRVEKVAKRSIVLSPDGTPVLSFAANGIRFGRASLLSIDNNHTQGAHDDIFNIDLAIKDADVQLAIGPQELLSSAIEIASRLGAPLGSTISLEPEATTRWNITPTSP